MLNIRNKNSKSAGICPFCFAHFKADTAPFRCMAVPQVCTAVIDEAHSKYWDQPNPKPMGRVFTPKNPKQWKWKPENQITCDVCATATHIRLCPECHNHLDPHFQEAVEYTLVVLADKREDAEIFISHAQEKMRQIVAHDLGYLIHLYAERPFDIHLERLEKKQPKRIHLHFYPLLTKEIGSSNPWYQKLIHHTHGILVLIPGQQLNPPTSTIEKTLEKLCAEPISILTALVFTGLEQITPFLSPHSLILDPPHHVKGVDINNLLRASNESMGYLGTWGYVNVLHLMRKSLPHRLASFVDKSLRVEDPVLWLLYQLGALGKPPAKDH
jgi:hypothetical protein